MRLPEELRMVVNWMHDGHHPTTGRYLMAPLYLATALEPSSWMPCSLEISWDSPSWEKTADTFCLPLKANLILVAGRYSDDHKFVQNKWGFL